MPSLVLPRIVIMLQHLRVLSNVRSIMCQVITYKRLKAIENFKLLALKMVTATFERCKTFQI